MAIDAIIEILIYKHRLLKDLRKNLATESWYSPGGRDDDHSRKRALAIALVPLVLGMARVAVITVAAWRGVTGVRELFC